MKISLNIIYAPRLLPLHGTYSSLWFITQGSIRSSCLIGKCTTHLYLQTCWGFPAQQATDHWSSIDSNNTLDRLTLKWLGHCFFQNVISFSDVVHLMCNIFIWNWFNTMNVYSALWILMAWCFSIRASVATVLTTHPCVSRCLRVNSLSPWEPISPTINLSQFRIDWIFILFSSNF